MNFDGSLGRWSFTGHRVFTPIAMPPISLPSTVALLSLLVAASAGAQEIHKIVPAHPDTTTPAAPVARVPAGSRAKISGIVFDSLHARPLAGATVILSGTPVSVVTGPAGEFALDVDSLPEGPHTLGFFHPTLDSLGITPPTRSVVVRHGEPLYVELAVPSMTTIVNAVCPDTSRTADRGLVMGVVRDAETDEPLAKALVVVMWTGMSVGNTTVTKVPRAVNTTVDSQGSFRLCGVPASTPVRAQARLGNKSSGWIDLTLPPGGLLIRNFLIGAHPTAIAAAPAPTPAAPQSSDTTPSRATTEATARTAAPPHGNAPARATTPAAAPRQAPLGTAVLTGTVMGEKGQPLEGAQVMLLGTTLAARVDYRGAFRLSGLPAGTRTVEVRLISYAPKHYTVDLSPRRESRLDAVLDEKATVLDPVTTVAKTGSDAPGFDQRKARGMGSYISREDIEKRGSVQTTDLFRTVPGVTVMFDGNQYQVVSARAGAMSCQMQWYIDGSPYNAGLDDIDRMLRPDEIEAIEVYRSANETPVEFQGPNSACGTIVLWTKKTAGKKSP